LYLAASIDWSTLGYAAVDDSSSAKMRCRSYFLVGTDVGIAQLTPPPNGQPVASTPAVMLSPKARKRSALSFGVFVTLTVKLHEAVRWLESRAVQVTVVDPTAKLEPLAGVQDVTIGVVPSLTSGAG
jgi:hypothetical protein